MNAISSANPFWGPPSSRANFCEADYTISRYIAEFINSLTNLVYLIYGIYGLRQLRQKQSKNGSLRSLPYWGLIAVGVCSFAFHVSLKLHTQMMDDISMHLTTTPVLHRVLTANSNRRDSFIVATLLSSMLLCLVVFHVIFDELTLHYASFVVTVAVIGALTTRLVRSRTISGSNTQRQVWGMIIFGAAIFNLGFWIWLIDGWACEFLTKLREAVGLPWAFLLELHGWWHICTGIGAYIFIAVIDQLASGEDLENIQQSFAWPASWASTSIFAGRGSCLDKDVSKKQE